MGNTIDHLAAARLDGKALGEMPGDQRTADLCLEAVIQNPDAIEHVPRNVSVAVLDAIQPSSSTDQLIHRNCG